MLKKIFLPGVGVIFKLLAFLVLDKGHGFFKGPCFLIRTNGDFSHQCLWKGSTVDITEGF